VANRTLKVEIIGDASSFQKALGKALGLAAVGAGVAIGAGFLVTLKRGFDELADAQKVAAQTAAVIKSTGAAANVSKAQVEDYATTLSELSGVDDEVIASGENMLLTFKNIRNEAGAGNDIFRQSTVALLDMSTALGTDMNKSAIQLGKALNDPIKGITALQRVGVSFTAGQKETIKGMVEAGNVMGAQKLILKELTSEFGGSAKAFGETMPGQLQKLKNAFDEVAGQIVSGMLPAITAGIKILGKGVDAVGNFVGKLSAAKGFKAKFKIVWTGIKDAVSALIDTFDKYFISGFTTYSGGGIGRSVATFHQGLLQQFRMLDWGEVGQKILDGIVQGMKDVATIAARLVSIIQSAMAQIDWSAMATVIAPGFVVLIGTALSLALDPAFWIEHWELALAIGVAAFSGAIGKMAGKLALMVVAPLKGVGGRMVLAIAEGIESFSPRLASAFITAVTFAMKAVAAAVVAIGKTIDDAFSAMWKRIGSLTKELLQAGLVLAIIAALKDMAAAVARGAVAVLAAIQDLAKKIPEFFSNLGTGIAGKFRQAFDAVYQILSNVASNIFTFAAKIALAIIEPFTHLPSKIGQPFRDAKDAINQTLDRLKSEGAAKASAAANAIVAAMRGPVGQAQSAGFALGRSLLQGVSAGINSQLQSTLAEVAAAGNRITGAMSAAFGNPKSPAPVTIPLGRSLMEGIVEGIEQKDKETRARIKSILANPALLAEIGAAAKELGAGAVRQIIGGVVGLQPSLAAQMKEALRQAVEAGRQAIADARQGYADAFASLFQAGADAIAAKYADWDPPALLRKQREAEEREKAALVASIADAQKALQAAVAAGAALPPLKMGEVPTEEFKKAEADILAAQKSLDDLLFQQEQKRLEEKAVQQKIDHDAMIAAEQKKFASLLGVIQNQYAKHKITYEQMQAKIRALLASFDIDFTNAGKAWGNALANGIRDAKKAVENASKELAQVMKDNLKPGSPAKKGPLSTFDMFKAGRQFGMDWAAGMASASGAAGKASAKTAGAGSGGFENIRNQGNIFDFGGTPPPGGFGPDFEGSRPGWADRELWDTIAKMAAKTGKFDALIDAVTSGSIKANAGLLSQLFYARTRKTWNDFPARIAKILDDMRGPEGLSSAEAAAKYGLKQGGYTKRDGFAFLHKNEIVTPMPSRGIRGMGGGTTIIVNANGVMAQDANAFARVVTPYIEGELRRSQRRGNATITLST
jgi:Flp pilus assembly pilin Flp